MRYNFDFIKEEWQEFYEAAVEAEKSVLTAPRTSAFYSRLALQRAVKWLYKNDSSLKMPYKDTLAALIHEQTFKDNLAPGLFKPLEYIKSEENNAVHSERRIHHIQAMTVLCNLFNFFRWMNTYYSANPAKGINFDENLLVKEAVAAIEDKTVEELKSLEKQLAERDAKLAETQKEDEELRKQVKSYKEKNSSTTFENEDFSEAVTRDLFIDLMLREAGWNLDEKKVHEYEVRGMPSPTGLGNADYVLWGDNGLPLAVVEAKRTKKDAENGKHQAWLYANCLEQMKGQRPIIFYTNGYETCIWDDVNYPPREVQGFYTKDQLQLMVDRRTASEDLKKFSVNKAIASSYYQEAAITKATEDFTKKMRKALLSKDTETD